jgi:carbonic anhydrase
MWKDDVLMLVPTIRAKRALRSLWIQSALLWMALGCSTAPLQQDDHYYLAKDKHQHAASWSYSGATGPAFWGDLSKGYRMAKLGKQQSPIDIDTSALVAGNLGGLVFHYRGETPGMVNNGHTIQHNHEDDGSRIEFEGKRFLLEQFHFHAPSEHTIDGKHFPVEIHLVHRASDGEIAVVAVFLEEGSSSIALRLIAGEKMPDKHGEKATMKQPVYLRDLLPSKASYYTYEGSITTPPCTEGIRWILLKHRVEASADLLQKMASILQGNNRPVQPLHGRKVEH